MIYQLLDAHAPVLLAVLALSGIVAASSSTASGAILATSAVTVRNIFGVRREVEAGHHDPLLRWTRLAMLPVVAIGVFLAVRVSQTGILLTLAFDLMLACLIAPFILGLFWKRSTSTAALVGAGVGFVVRVVLLVLTCTLYGVPNDLLHVDNDLIGAGFDGWATMVAAAAGIGSFVITALLTRGHDDEQHALRHVDRMAATGTDEPALVAAP